MDSKVTYHQQVSYCGKPRCRRCREGIGHGPYWYAYKTVNGRTVRTYIGKEATPEILAQAQVNTLASSEFAHTMLRLSVLGQFRLEQRANGLPSSSTPPTSAAASPVPRQKSGVNGDTASTAGESRAAATPGLMTGSISQWEQVTEASLQHQRVRSLLSCLVSSPGRKLGREQVMYMLWPELDLETASHRLDRAVHSLRQALEPGRARPATSKLLLTEHSTLALADQTLFWVDADAFEACIARARAAQEQKDPGLAERLLEEATQLYKGDFMPTEQELECVKNRRESLRRSWISLLLELADLRITREAMPAAIDILDRLLSVDPTSEAGVQRLMFLLAQMGRRGEAIQIYQRFASLLRKDYGIVPLPQTQALYERVRGGNETHDAALAVPSDQSPPGSQTLLRPGQPDSSSKRGDTAHPVTSVPSSVDQRQPGREKALRASSDTRETLHVPGENGTHPPTLAPQAHMHIGRTQQGPLVGREKEMTRLNELLLIAESTRRQRLAGERRSSMLMPLELNAPRLPQCVLLVGEVGIGKTRLAEEVAREAKRRNWAVAWCRSYTQESSVPYRLWTETLRKAMSQGLWQRGEVTRRPLIYQPLRSLLPELQELLPPNLHTLPPPPEQEQLRLWEATSALLSTICESTTLLVVLDDIQWADSSSCEMLTYLVRQMRGQPIMFLCTCRDSELPQGHPLRSALTDLQREKAAELLPIAPLSDREIREMLSYLPGRLVESISERASGNPFFAEELARELAAAGKDSASDPTDLEQLPATIQAVLELRLARITQPCQRLLERGAVLGGSFGFDTVREMASAGQPADEDLILDLLEEALQAGMLTEEGSGMAVTYHFWHPLLQTYLYEHLSYARRASLHRRAAQVLQSFYAINPAEGAAEIAEHLVKGGGVPASIVHYAELAADRDYNLSAYRDAERHYRLVLEQQGELSFSAPQEERLHRAAILERLGECAMILGKFEEAQSFYMLVLEMRSTCTFASQTETQYEAQIEALIWGEIGETWRHLGDKSKARESFKKGEEVLRSANVTAGAAWARIRYQESHTLLLEGNLAEALTMANEALTLVEALPAQQQVAENYKLSTLTWCILNGDPINLGRMYMLVGIIAGASGQNTKSVQYLTIALNIFEKHDYQREIAIVCSNLGNIYLIKAEYNLAQAVFHRTLDIAEKIGDAPTRSVGLINLGVLAARSGNLIEAERWYCQALDLITQMGELFYIGLFHSYVATALIEQGRLNDAEPLLIRALRISRSRHIAPCIGFALVAVGHLRLARVLAGERQMNRLRGSQNGRKNQWRQRLLLQARNTLLHALHFEGLEVDTVLQGKLLLSNIALLLGEVEGAYELAGKALDEARSSELVWLEAQAQCLLGRVLACQNQQTEAFQQFQQALAIFKRTGMRLEYARTLQAYNEILLSSSADPVTREQALTALGEARQIFEECHASLDLRSVDALNRKATASSMAQG